MNYAFHIIYSLSQGRQDSGVRIQNGLLTFPDFLGVGVPQEEFHRFLQVCNNELSLCLRFLLCDQATPRRAPWQAQGSVAFLPLVADDVFLA